MTTTLPAKPAVHTQLPALATALYDQLPGEQPAARVVLQVAARSYARAVASGASRADRHARDFVLADPSIDDAQRALAAAVVALQRKRLRLHTEPAMLALGRQARAGALRLGAVLRVAAEVAQHDDARFALTTTAHTGELRLDAADGAALRERVTRQADLWQEAIGPLTILDAPGEDALAVAHLAAELLGDTDVLVTVSGDTPAAQGARHELRRTFEKMLACEDDLRNDAEPVRAVHEMRVVLRRLRAALQILAPLDQARRLQRFRRGLRRIATTLGGVRDLDVLIGAMDQTAITLPAAEHQAIAATVKTLRAARTQAWQRLEHDLTSARYTALKHDIAEFLTSTRERANEETGRPLRVRDIAGSAIWRIYEQLRAFEPVLASDPHDDARHRARIAGKRLRYSLDLFADALGPRTEPLVAQLATLQEQFGQLQDAVAARTQLAGLGLATDLGALAYLAALDAAHTGSLASANTAWRKVTATAFGRQLADALVRM